LEGPQNVLEDPEAAVAAVVAQEDHCGRGLGGLVAASRQVEGLGCQLPLGPHVVAAGLGFEGGLAGNHQDHQDLPVGWAAPGIALVAGSAELAPPAAVEGPLLGGLAVAEVPGSYEVGELHTGADRAVQAQPSSGGSPSAAGRASAWPAYGRAASPAAEHISAAAEEVPNGEELDRTGCAHRG